MHPGYEWNKYNETRNDTDNPPPKVVQGYKFNIFYPDLIDKTKVPTYKIVKEEGNDEKISSHRLKPNMFLSRTGSKPFKPL
ncbi:hypothetical protein MSAN_01766600 [Mycena sanguinolenta]|uniref:Splicing factor Cactin C-terminal domain-containing protein n=1 Tax=Mycena sanguinolenta TaxID=230812 RepID=A0A8H6XU22_9AGAR|nr:hypothetical protein MSAN_01766600 [Mycena sanguinolenta]